MSVVIRPERGRGPDDRLFDEWLQPGHEMIPGSLPSHLGGADQNRSQLMVAADRRVERHDTETVAETTGVT